MKNRFVPVTLSQSLTAKIWVITIGSFIVTLSLILLFANNHLSDIINKSQHSLYNEKILIIKKELQRKNDLLQQTGLAEALIYDFQQTALKDIKNSYYTEEEPSIYPVITDKDFHIILHPDKPEGSILLPRESINNGEISQDKGDFNLFENGEKFWYIYQDFSPWDWKVFYILPDAVKYSDVYSFRRQFLIIMLLFTLLFTLIITLFLTKLIQPITRLTRITQQITRGDLNQKIPIENKDEIGILSRSFRDMQEAVKEKIADLRYEISIRQKTEISLKNARNEISDIMDSISSAIIGVSSTGHITQLNNRAEFLMGIGKREAIGSHIRETFPPLESEWPKIQLAQSSGEKILDSHKVFSINGLNRIYDVNIFPLKSVDDKGVVLRIDDITEKSRMEEQLSQSRKMDAIGQLAGGIAHDFNNMLGGIMAATELMQNSEKYKDDMDYLNLIMEASTRAADLVAKLLGFSKNKKGPQKVLDLHEQLDQTLFILKSTIDKKIEIQTDFSAENHRIKGNSAEIQNIILNLAINAAHAMPHGGRLKILTRNTQLSNNYCNYSPFDLTPGDYIELDIKDTGTGIPPQYIDRIFEPFFTTKSQGEGTGLGLASVYGSIRQHHGSISVYSEENKGTLFKIYLPCIEQQVAEFSENQRGPLWKGSGTVLLVDDEKIIRLTGKPMLEDMGFNVLLAENGQEAIEIFIENQDSVDLVISDMIMPYMNGKELFQQLMGLDKDCPVIISSGFTKNENLDALKDQGLRGFIQKPFNRYELNRLIQSILAPDEMN